MVSFSVREEIERTIKDLNIIQSDFSEVSKLNWNNILHKTQEKFLVKNKYKVDIHLDWQAFKEPCVTLRFINDDGFKYLNYLIDDNQVYFIVKDQGNKMWVFEGTIANIIDIIGNCCYLDEYYIVSKKFDWILCENHHRTFIGSGLQVVEKINEFIKKHYDKVFV